MADSVLQVRDVSLARGERQILARVTFDAAAGEILAIMGLSGSGKTTLLRTIAGLEPFQSGEMVVGDLTIGAGDARDRRLLRALGRKVGMVFQFHCLFEHLSAIDNVCLAPIHAYGVGAAEARRRGMELLAAFGVEHRAAALPRHLSGGEAQRVAIARALAVNPPLLLMDEPTASLDPARRAELADLVRGLAGENRTLIIATHDEEFARSLASRSMRIEHGAIREL